MTCHLLIIDSKKADANIHQNANIRLCWLLDYSYFSFGDWEVSKWHNLLHMQMLCLEKSVLSALPFDTQQGKYLTSKLNVYLKSTPAEWPLVNHICLASDSYTTHDAPSCTMQEQHHPTQALRCSSAHSPPQWHKSPVTLALVTLLHTSLQMRVIGDMHGWNPLKWEKAMEACHHRLIKGTKKKKFEGIEKSVLTRPVHRLKTAGYSVLALTCPRKKQWRISLGSW